MSLETNSKASAGSGWAETAKIVVQALAIAMVVRVFFFQPFNIPSGSMKSTLLIGDYLFVSKLSYGYSRFSFPFSPHLFSGRIFAAEPKRGDVVVFRLPQDESLDYIKRVIGLPGDEIQMKSGILYINGTPVPKVYKDEFANTECDPYFRHCRRVVYKRFEETLPEGLKYTVLDLEPAGDFDNTEVFKVPPGHYFMMGDNRDNSADSRASVGYVPFENLIGRAEIIFFSAAVDEPDAMRWLSPWTWPFDIRWSRFFNLVR
ncbi:MAG: signal peptidase I [Hyphomicrobium zavarzinii]|jgi:signal peptidase I|uniref:signal peptidase I n=1 Tax=Hyphomicrobium TaxID=81 RepID=UPI00037BF1C0|nr:MULTISPECIES: signal peptidase I [Hyphomicrobium]MBL8847224.1 signal peptidase I [Hyphomicrobium zavarzinii]WBT37453.1 signal peptidase I [Hyphomicrobium sp. DMF-1]HML42289.1 signal peptidase I [Hyphomicrobium zavarzinii]